MNARNRGLSCLACLVLAAAPALGQFDQGTRKYEPFPIDQNAAEIIRNRLKLEKDLGPLKDIIQQVMNNPKAMNADFMKKLEGVKVDDKLKEAVQGVLEKDPALKTKLDNWINEQKKMGSKASPEERKSLNALADMLKKPDHAPENKSTPLPKTPDPKPNQDGKPQDTLAKAAENFMKKAENTELREWLRDSPAWQQAFGDLRTALENPQASKWKPGDWTSKLLKPDGKAWKLGESTLERIKNMPRPNLERWNLDLSVPGLGSIPTPNIDTPSLPNFHTPSMPSFNVGATWLLLAALCLLVGWQLSRWSKRSVPLLDWRATLGPWPVQPDEVATRIDLVRAFDFLAILTLGIDAKSWNHQAIARRWCANSPANAPLADSLARLYEQARYTDGPAELTSSQRDQARQSLLQLTEAR